MIGYTGAPVFASYSPKHCLLVWYYIPTHLCITTESGTQHTH